RRTRVASSSVVTVAARARASKEHTRKGRKGFQRLTLTIRAIRAADRGLLPPRSLATSCPACATPRRNEWPCPACARGFRPSRPRAGNARCASDVDGRPCYPDPPRENPRFLGARRLLCWTPDDLRVVEKIDRVSYPALSNYTRVSRTRS